MSKSYIKPEATKLCLEAENYLYNTSTSSNEEDSYGEAKSLELEDVDEIWTNDRE